VLVKDLIIQVRNARQDAPQVIELDSEMQLPTGFWQSRPPRSTPCQPCWRPATSGPEQRLRVCCEWLGKLRMIAAIDPA
jgi:hypothetical protein